MNARIAIAILAVLLVLQPAALATARPAAVPAQPQFGGELIHGAVPGAAKAAGDTIMLMGPHGSGAPYIGSFESAGGGADWNGWTSRDYTVDPDTHWQVDTYGVISGLFSAWCGDASFPSCDAGDPAGGYGNSWDVALEWRGAVADPGLPCQVDVSAVVNHDVEPMYDYCYLSVLTAGGRVDLWTADGIGTAVVLAETHIYQPGDYVGLSGDQVVVQFRVTSDPGWSDSDCEYPSAGAMQVDDVVITLSNGIGAAHDFEDGTLGPFVPVGPVGVGDFAQLLNNLQDVDPCASNSSYQVVFIDDGVVVPGTGGSPCINWCYGPNGFIVNTTGGLAGPDHHLHNVVISPVMVWPDQGRDGALFAYGHYGHEDLSADSPGIFEIWGVRSVASGNPADLEDAPWLDRNFVNFPSGAYQRAEEVVSDLLVPGRTHVQVMLGASEFGYNWGFDGDDGYPAPYFDNVRFQVFPQSGPELSAAEQHLAQDAFPANGGLDPVDLGANSVRFDMAQNISRASHLRNDPGDSLVIFAAPVRAGAVLVEAPRMHWRLQRNPVFDAVRSSGLPDVGSVLMGAIESGYQSWSADLPDTGFLFPGDVLHYYFAATDNVGGDQRTALLPADTTGFGDFSGALSYDPSFTMRALPSVRWGGSNFNQPGVLFWNDFARRGEGGAIWDEAFTWNALRLGREYDVYYTNAPTSGVGNGLGGRATLAQLAGYDDLVYSSADLFQRTIANGDAASGFSPDVQLLEAWLALGGKDAFLAGDNLASDLAYSGTETAAFLQNRLGLSLASSDIRPLIHSQVAPKVVAAAGNQVFLPAYVVDWIAGGSCPAINTFDAVTPTGPGMRLAEFTTAGGQSGVYPYSAATLAAANGARVISLPYDLMFVETADAGSVAASTRLFRAVGAFLGFILVVGDVPDADVPGSFATRHYPNPFNPSVRIECSIARAGRLTVNVYDMRGRLVRTVLDEHVEQGVAVSWDGRDAAGAQAASGVYFYVARMHDDVQVGRMMLLK